LRCPGLSGAFGPVLATSALSLLTVIFHVLAAFPLAHLEDPHDLPEIAQRLTGHLERVSYDSPIRSAQDIGATPLAGRV
jgi:hypothetical protein